MTKFIKIIKEDGRKVYMPHPDSMKDLYGTDTFFSENNMTDKEKPSDEVSSHNGLRKDSHYGTYN